MVIRGVYWGEGKTVASRAEESRAQDMSIAAGS